MIAGRSRAVTRAELISLIQQLAKELGRTPRISDLKRYSMPPYTKFYKEFNSWNEALKAAGFSPNIHICAKSELIAILQRKAKECGRTPRIADIESDKNMPSHAAYIAAFGTWNTALKEAGLCPNKADYKIRKVAQ